MEAANIVKPAEMVQNGTPSVADAVGNSVAPAIQALVENGTQQVAVPPQQAPQPAAPSPPRNQRRGPSTFSIDSLLFGVMQKANVQSSPNAQDVVVNTFPLNPPPEATQAPPAVLVEAVKPQIPEVLTTEKLLEKPTEKPAEKQDVAPNTPSESPKPVECTPPKADSVDGSANITPSPTPNSPVVPQLSPKSESPEKLQESSATSTKSTTKLTNGLRAKQICEQAQHELSKKPRMEEPSSATTVTASTQSSSPPPVTQTSTESQKVTPEKTEEEQKTSPAQNGDTQGKTSMPITPTSARLSDDALFKTPSPIDRRNRKPKTRYFVKKDLPPPPPPKKEEVVPKEPPKPIVYAKNPLADHSVDLIFLALVGEDPIESRKSDKSINDLVLAKKKELEEETSAQLNTVSSGEDSRREAADLRRLEEVVDEVASAIVQPSAPTTSGGVRRVIATPSRRGRKPKARRVQTSSDTDTDTVSTGDVEEDKDREMVEQEGVTDANTPSSSERVTHNTRKRGRLPAQPQKPNARRSARIMDRAGFFYEHPEVSFTDEDDEMEIEHQVSSKSKAPAKKPRSAVSKNLERLVEEPSPHEVVPQKKTRAATRAEYYQKRDRDDKIIYEIMSHVMTPMASRDCKILDHFCYPVIRRAIVNKNTLCYAISMLQLMLRVPQIYSIVKCHSHDSEITRGCFLCLMGNIISARPSFDEYSTFVALMKTTWKGVEVDMMHCVMEAMQKFFNRFDEDYLKGLPEFAAKMPEGFSPVRSLFEIQIVNQYKCGVCKYASHSMDKAIYLSIDLTKKSDGTMQSLVDNIHKPTAVLGMSCPVCRGREFYCTTYFHKLPEVLLYFVPRVRTKKREKDMTVVQVQKELVLKDSEKQHKYALCSFLTHSGATGNKGHYKQYEVDRTDGVKFNEFDDARVILNSKLSRDITVVLAMFRKEEAVAKDAPIDVIFDGRGNVAFSHPRHGR